MRTTAPDPGLRVDARRNRAAVLESAVTLLAERPAASMREIADASGLGRSTVYRHFPTREDLVRAIFEHLLEESREVTREVVETDLPARELLQRLAPRFITLGERYRFLDAHPELGREVLAAEGVGPDDPIVTWITKAQAGGEVRNDVPVPFLLGLVRGMSVAAMAEIRAGRTTIEQAGEHLGVTLADALAPLA